MGAGAADFRNEQTGDDEGIVPHEFGFNAPAALTGQLAVVGVAGAQVPRRGRDLPVGVAVDDEADHVLHVPAAVHEFAGQPVEKFGVHRRLALHAKIVQHPGQARAKELFPKAVHKDPGRERVFAGNDPLGKI